MNKTIITGNLGKDAEIKIKKDGATKYAVFTIANTEKRGETEYTMWINCYIQNEKMVNSKLIEYLKKGTKVLIDGQLKADIWNKEDGTAEVSYAFNVFNLELIGGSQSRPSNEIPESVSSTQPVVQVQPVQAVGEIQQNQIVQNVAAVVHPTNPDLANYVQPVQVAQAVGADGDLPF
jgi:single-strand DNA-binding protein